MKLDELIKKNDKSISPLAWIKRIEAIYEADCLGAFDEDLRLNRAIALLGVAGKQSRIEGIKQAVDSMRALNSWRSQQPCKPQGFDVLVEYELDNVLDLCVEVGFGTKQIRAASHIFSFKTLDSYGLLEYRNAGV